MTQVHDSTFVSENLPRASEQDDPHPRPQLIRGSWVDLSGAWEFAFDDAERGETEHWYENREYFDRQIIVPFPPESLASGIGDDAFHDVVWYRREISLADIGGTGHTSKSGDRLLLHFGAVDYRCSVWLNGSLIGRHEGGHTPFMFEIQDSLRSDGPQVLVVRAEDRAADVAQPRGKQDWLRDPHKVWYRRTTGIWQPVWLEATPATAIEQVHWTVDIPTASVSAEVRLNAPVEAGTVCRIELRHGDVPIGAATFTIEGQRAREVISLQRISNGQGYEDLLWAPGSPTLIDATVALLTEQSDAVASYFGITSTTVGSGRFLLNDRPFYVRSVLSQGYWPDSHLAAPSGDALREEVELILAMGFNSARVHQKVEDPRFLYWADRLGLTLWGEAPSAFEFSATAVERTTREWLDVLDRDRSHPSIITWVPLNESWGVQQISHDPAQVNFAKALVALTKAIDPTRPVISNDGWEHAGSDIVTIHDYSDDPEEIANRYGTDGARESMLHGIGPAGRKILIDGDASPDAPFMLTEFGGIKFSAGEDGEGAGAWGYSAVSTREDFENAIAQLYLAIQPSPWLAGSCYTQLTDTMQEANGLATEQRIPKFSLDRIREIVTGEAMR